MIFKRQNFIDISEAYQKLYDNLESEKRQLDNANKIIIPVASNEDRTIIGKISGYSNEIKSTMDFIKDRKEWVDDVCTRFDECETDIGELLDCIKVVPAISSVEFEKNVSQYAKVGFSFLEKIGQLFTVDNMYNSPQTVEQLETSNIPGINQEKNIVPEDVSQLDNPGNSGIEEPKIVITPEDVPQLDNPENPGIEEPKIVIDPEDIPQVDDPENPGTEEPLVKVVPVAILEIIKEIKNRKLRFKMLNLILSEVKDGNIDFNNLTDDEIDEIGNSIKKLDQCGILDIILSKKIEVPDELKNNYENNKIDVTKLNGLEIRQIASIILNNSEASGKTKIEIMNKWCELANKYEKTIKSLVKNLMKKINIFNIDNDLNKDNYLNRNYKIVQNNIQKKLESYLYGELMIIGNEDSKLYLENEQDIINTLKETGVNLGKKSVSELLNTINYEENRKPYIDNMPELK